MSRRWKLILAISLLLNLFLVGAGVGAYIVRGQLLSERSEVRRGGERQRMDAAFQALPPERREALREIMRARALGAADDLGAAREARQEATQLMSAERYDAAAVTAALTRAREAEGRARARIDGDLGGAADRTVAAGAGHVLAPADARLRARLRP